jgi:extradiol dioxygenase family protein
VPVPVTAFYSRRDRVVAWRACIDQHNTHVDHVEVGSTHVGLGIDPDVWLGIVERLHRRGRTFVG